MTQHTEIAVTNTCILHTTCFLSPSPLQQKSSEL